MNSTSSSESIFQKIDYGQCSKFQKLALLMIVIGPENAARLLKDFDDSDIELICREIANFRIIDEPTQEKVLEEFTGIIGQGFKALLGGPLFAGDTIRKAKGEFRAANLLGRISPVGSSLDVIKEISDMEARQIYNLIRYEQSQTIAFVVSYLHVDKASQVIAMLGGDQKSEILERIGQMDDTSLENVGKVVKSLRQHFAKSIKQTMHRSGGIRVVADILNIIDKEESRVLLNNLEQRNPDLGNLIRRKMFSFSDLIRLEAMDLQRVTREIEMNDLVMSLKSASAQLQEAIFHCVSKRAAETIREEMDLLGPVRLKDVEEAQDRIIQVVRRLEEEGEITLDQGGGDRVLV